MISQNALHHAEKCRFCWMCRHLCPIQRQTGKEINTPRAKGLLLSMVNKETQSFDRDMAQAMYECVLCDACTNNCATGYQPPVFIREARTQAVVNDLAPETVIRLIDNVLDTGNIYGLEKTSFAREGTDVLVYIGEVAATQVPEMAENFLLLLEKAGITAKVLENEPASGVMLGDLMGYTEEVFLQAKTCAEAINKVGLPVVVLNSYDAEIMKQRYPMWGCEIKTEIITATSYVYDLILKKKIKSKNVKGIKGACQDDDRSARSFYEFEPIRAMAEAAGYELAEMFSNKKMAKSCGTAVSKAYMPEIIAKVAAGRWEDFERSGCSALLVANPEAYLCLKESIPEGKCLVDLFGDLL